MDGELAMRTMTHADLVAQAIRDEREFTSRFGPASLSRPARIFLAALAHRMNGHPLLVAVPDGFEPTRRPQARFAAWLDAGAPGLVDAACECMVEDFLGLGGHVVDELDRKYVSYDPGPPPAWASWSFADLVLRLRWLLAGSPAPYGTVIADPERALQDFIAAEIGDPRSPGWAAFSIDPASLAPRSGYFSLASPSEGCSGWSDGTTLKVLFTNGGD
jgi:hypothetical protein